MAIGETAADFCDACVRTTHDHYHCAKFGWNQCSSFDNMQVLIFCEFGWKTPIHAPKMVFVDI